MRRFARSVTAAAVACAAFMATNAHAADYNFDVLYFGNGSASLAAGSDDPTMTMLSPGDSFMWTITAQGGQWTVETGGSFFPLMAFATNESAIRTGDFTLSLGQQGAEVFSLSESGATNEAVHIGTNTVVLSTGLVFDSMQLAYTFNSIEPVSEDASSMRMASTDIDTTLNGLLPIFGAPEQNRFYPGVIYAPIPEPQTWALMLAGLAGMGAYARKRRAGRIRS